MKRLLLGVAVVLVLSGCSSGQKTGAYQDGYTVAHNLDQGQTFLTSGPVAQCTLLASVHLVSQYEDVGQWEAGCEAALAHSNFVHPTTTTSNSPSTLASPCHYSTTRPVGLGVGLFWSNGSRRTAGRL